MQSLLWVDWPERGEGMTWACTDDDLDEVIFTQIRLGCGTLQTMTERVQRVQPRMPHGVLHYRLASRLQRLREQRQIEFDLHGKCWREVTS